MLHVKWICNIVNSVFSVSFGKLHWKYECREVVCMQIYMNKSVLDEQLH